MSEPKNTAPNTQSKNKSSGALILIILTAIAIVASLILGGIRLFGGDAERTPQVPTGEPTVDPFDPDFKLEAWPSEQPLASYGLLSGTLLIPTDDYTPSNLQKIVKNGQFLADDIQIDGEANEALIRMLTKMNSELQFAESITVHTAYKADGDYRTGMTVRFRLVRSSGEYCYLREATGDNPATWFEANAWKYGFILRYPEGNALEGKETGVSDVYRYVGIPHAYYITKLLKLEDETVVPTLEDYLALSKNATAKNPITFEVSGNDADNGVYNVYYVSAADADKALLREGAELYGVSGIGDGYIVTSVIRNNDETDDETASEDQTEESTDNQTEEST